MNHFCHCYDYICPGPKGDPRGCGWRYYEGYDEKNDEIFAHWYPGMRCANCNVVMPNISCKKRNCNQHSNVINSSEQLGLFDARK